MKIVLQRVLSASVSVNETVVGAIDRGYLLYLGISHHDSTDDIEVLTKKVTDLRLLSSEGKAFHESIIDQNGSILVVSQFTLYANTQKGRRPSFSEAADAEKARQLYEMFVDRLRQRTELRIETGQFQADMQVRSCNDGPVTLILET